MPEAGLNTQLKIKNALLTLMIEERFDMINVSDVIERSGVSRATFYRHFDTKEAILADIREAIDVEVRAVMYEAGKSDLSSPFEMLTDMVFPILYAHRDELRVLYGENGDPGWLPMLRKQYTHWVEVKLYGDSHVHMLGTPHHYEVALVVNVTISMIQAWITQPVPENPLIFKPIFLKLMNVTVADLAQQ